MVEARKYICPCGKLTKSFALYCSRPCSRKYPEAREAEILRVEARRVEWVKESQQ